MRTYLLSLLLLPLLAMGQQNLTIDVATRFGVNYSDGSKTVAQKWATGKDTVALPYAWARYKAQGMNYATFRTRYVGTAIAKECAWMQEAPNNLKTGYQNTYTFAIWPAGQWKMNSTAQIPRGGMEGKSSFWYAGSGGDQGQHATEFVMDDATWWPSTDTERRLFETPNADRTDNAGYNESFRVERVKLTGPSVFGDAKTRIGIFLKRAGECSWVHQVRSDSFQYGFVANDGVPLSCGTLTAFWNEIGGFAGIGTALATINIGTLSGDSNKRLLMLIPGYASAGGGRVNVGLLKSEEGITAGTVHRDQVAGYFEGQSAVNVGTVNFSNSNGAKPEAMFVLNPTLGGGQTQSSVLNVGAAIGFGYTTLVKNLVTGQTWSSPGDYAGVSFTHYSKGDKLETGCADVKSSIGPTTPTDPTTPTNPPVTGLKGIAFAEGTELNVKRTADFAVDGNPSTFWISGTAMKDGQTFIVELPTARAVSGITFSSGTYQNSYPRLFEVATALTNSQTAYTTRAPNVQGAVNSRANFSATCKFIKITCKAADGNWWAINDLQVVVP